MTSIENIKIASIASESTDSNHTWNQQEDTTMPGGGSET